MTVPGHPRTSETLVRTYSIHLYFHHTPNPFAQNPVISYVRIWLKHETPNWVEYPEFFITICTRPQHLNQLCLPERSDFILRSAEEYYLLHRWHCSLMVLMPDHLHALIQVPERLKLTRVISSWKSYLTKILGIHWHRGFFDHRIRRCESLNEKWNYIVMNPVRAGFVKNTEEWPYRWAPEGKDDRPRSS